VTLWRIRWALLYGVALCTARALGEFGAVSVVSGHIRGATNTVPLHIEVLYDDYDFSGAFAVSTLLVGAGFASLIAKAIASRLGPRDDHGNQSE
jgi:sulfate transport system permease protein